ncbi:MAG: FAD-containing oxidoreductase [Planctomycetes bacterium]|nr:FAD-containing oxidoreductase [Planctomycetota bacterium]
MLTKFDTIVVGTGQSGPALAHDLAKDGQRVAIIERRDFGGSCVNYGCIPTKAYVASARVAHQARTAREYGVHIGGDVRVDLKEVKARKDRMVEESSEGLEQSLRDDKNIVVIEGHGRFVGAKEIKVNDEVFTADTIILNVGARANRPDIPGLGDVNYLTSTTMLDLEELPQHLAIIGGGYVGLEFAQMFKRFGSHVTIIQRGPELLDTEDEDVSQAIRRIFAEDGIVALTDTEPARIHRNDGVRIELKGDAPQNAIEASHLLVATGRIPNTDTLGLREAGVDMDTDGYIQVDNHLRTSVDGVYAVGDCNGRGAFTHTSYNDYEVLRDHLLGDGERSVVDRIHAHAVYIDPPFARVGLTEREVRERGKPALIAKLGMDKVGRARERGETHGFMKVLVDQRSEQILGASILGINGDEAIHTFLDVMYARRPYHVLREAVHIHPTVCELVPTLLGKLKALE